jgi:hypothetical protein
MGATRAYGPRPNAVHASTSLYLFIFGHAVDEAFST